MVISLRKTQDHAVVAVCHGFFDIGNGVQLFFYCFGGDILPVHNHTVNGTNIREAPGLKSLILAEVPNGTLINTTGRVAVADGITWYEITLASGSDPGWIAGSMIGR